MEKRFGHYVFVAAILLAVLAGLMPALQTSTVMWVLIIFGFIVGIINVNERETSDFLIATIALMLVGSAGLGEIRVVGTTIDAVLTNINAIAVPAALVVSLKAIYALASRR